MGFRGSVHQAGMWLPLSRFVDFVSFLRNSRALVPMFLGLR